jgi:hypothetical protein
MFCFGRSLNLPVVGQSLRLLTRDAGRDIFFNNIRFATKR